MSKPVFVHGQNVLYQGFVVTVRRVAFIAGRVQYWIATPSTIFSFRWVDENEITGIAK